MSHIVQIPKVFDHKEGLPLPRLEFDNNTVKIGSRKSVLAVKQSDIVAQTISNCYPNLKTTIAKVSTLGDQVQNRPLYSFGGKALWTKELEILLLEDVGEFKQIDLISHSLKDMPTVLPDEFELGCIISREGMF
jgi:hydroxymethylbilane synthase